MALQPRGQRRTQIVTNRGKIARLGVGTITFSSNLLVKISVRSRSRFDRNDASERIFARGLIKMPVQAEVGTTRLWDYGRVLNSIFNHMTTFLVNNRIGTVTTRAKQRFPLSSLTNRTGYKDSLHALFNSYAAL